MRIVVDENVPMSTVRALREAGHAVTDLRESEEVGMDDAALWQLAQAEQALFITTDKWFATRWEEQHFGVLIIRLRQPNRAKIHERVMMAIVSIAQADWPGLLVVMRDTLQTVRRAPPLLRQD